LAVPIYDFFSLFLNAAETVPTLDCALRTARAESPMRGGRQEFGMRNLVAKFLADESGATAIEYCLIAAGLSIVIVVAVNGVGTALNAKFSAVSTSLK